MWKSGHSMIKAKMQEVGALFGGEMSGHGWAAMILGLAGTVALSVGLMLLAFHSSKRGYDDRVDDVHNPEFERDRERERKD